MKPGFDFHIVTRESNPRFGRILLSCDRNRNGECPFPLSPHPAANGVWQWDGNVSHPTITPSIDCHGGCGRHFVMTKGEI